ncbi:MAG: Asp-tRNA(Asn)/Glu-tRNA(Gln) amidotransferase subunit GatA [Tissierellia bacterium]|nr:Asp-tRNA(Asn)/Glu-tRNA(Gln) amidotransferase subunit GatA [Tissierellia bacterium]
MDIIGLSARQMQEKLMDKELSARDIVEAHLERIEGIEPELNAFITVTREEALRDADDLDRKIRDGERLGALAGIPVGIKDNIITSGIKTTCGSKMLEDFIPPYEATVIERIKEEDGIVLGKTNLDEFAIGSLTDTSYFGATKNPVDLNRTPGGSSGGSAAAVQAQEVAVTLGSDTGGSIRQPASYCGVVGIKPTYGLVSRYGLVAVANSLDQIGVFGRDVSDSALILGTIAGHDRRDSTSMDMESIDYLDDLDEDIKGMRIGLPREYFDIDMNDGIRDRVMEAVGIFESLGAKVDEVSLPNTKWALATYYVLAASEISSNLSRFDGVRYGYRAAEYESLDELYMNTRTEAFGREVKRRIMAGTYFLSREHAEEYYRKALQLRTLIRDDFDRVFEEYDIIISPTTPNLPFERGAENDPLIMAESDTFTVPVNLAGNCAISIPCGDVEGLPAGLQIIGDRFKERRILKAGYAFERYLSTGGGR